MAIKTVYTSYSGSTALTKIDIDYTYTQNTSNNSTTVTAKAYYEKLHAGATGWVGTSKRFSLTIGGHTESLNWLFDLRGRPVGYREHILTSSHTINHSSDGSLSDIGISVFCDTGTTSFGRIDGGMKLSVPNIPRSSTFSITPTADTGVERTITITKASSSFTHSLRYEFGSLSEQIIDKTNNVSIKWTPAEKFNNEMPTSTSKSGILFLDTYSGSTRVGTTTISFAVSVPSSIKPNVNLEVYNIGGHNGIYVQRKSQVRVITSEYGRGGAWVVSKTTRVGNLMTSSNDDFTTGRISQSGQIKITTTVTDTRGRTDTKEKTITVQPYFNPAITNLRAVRSNSSGGETASGNYIKINAGAYASASGGGNTVEALRVRYKEVDGSTWTTAGTGTAGSFSQDIEVIIPATSEKAFDIEAHIVDKYSSHTKEVTVGTAFVLMDFHSSGKSMAIGKVAEDRGILEVQGDVWLGSENKIRYLDGRYAVYTSSTDANNMTEEWVLGSGTNYPGGGFWYVNQIKYNSTNSKQIAYGYTNNEMYYRYCRNGTWSAWIESAAATVYPISGITSGAYWQKSKNGSMVISTTRNVTVNAGANVNSEWWFPHRFVGTPTIQITGGYTTGAVTESSLISVGVKYEALDRYTVFAIRNTSSTNRTASIQLTARGRWE